MTEQKDNFQLNKKWLGRGLVISCTINQDGDMIALSYDHDKVVAQNSDWLEREQQSWKKRELSAFHPRDHCLFGLF